MSLLRDSKPTINYMYIHLHVSTLLYHWTDFASSLNAFLTFAMFIIPDNTKCGSSLRPAPLLQDTRITIHIIASQPTAHSLRLTQTVNNACKCSTPCSCVIRILDSVSPHHHDKWEFDGLHLELVVSKCGHLESLRSILRVALCKLRHPEVPSQLLH